MWLKPCLLRRAAQAIVFWMIFNRIVILMSDNAVFSSYFFFIQFLCSLFYEKWFASDRVVFVNDCGQKLLFLHKSVVLGLLLDQFFNRTILPASAWISYQSSELVLDHRLHLVLLKNTIGDHVNLFLCLLLQNSPNVAVRFDDIDKGAQRHPNQFSFHTNYLDRHLIILQFLYRFDQTNRCHFTYLAEVNTGHIILLIFCHMIRVLKICSHWLLENFIDFYFFKVGLTRVLLINLTCFTLFHNIEIFGLISLMVQLATTDFYSSLKVLINAFKLAVVECTE